MRYNVIVLALLFFFGTFLVGTFVVNSTSVAEGNIPNPNNGFSYDDIVGKKFNIFELEYSCRITMEFINHDQLIIDYGNGDVELYSYDILPDGTMHVSEESWVWMVLTLQSKHNDHYFVIMDRAGGPFVEKTGVCGINSCISDFSRFNNSATLLKNWFLENGLWESTITEDGQIFHPTVSTVGRWWVKDNIFYYDYPDEDTGCIDRKALKIENNKLYRQTDAPCTYETIWYFEESVDNKPPAAPKLTVTTHGTTVTLSWNSVPNADGYILHADPSQPSVDFDGAYEYEFDLGNLTSVSFDLWEGAYFYVALKAYNSAGSSGYSNREYIFAGVPTAPTLTVSIEGNAVTLSWDAVPNADGYTLFYAPYPEASYVGDIDMGNQTSLPSFDGKGYAFYVAVQAYNSAGSSGYSNIEYFDISEGSNTTPTATITIPSDGSTFDTGDTISFDGSGSDTDGSIVSYQWDFGDGSTSTQQNPSHAHSSAGTYIVTLTVTDDDGATGTDSVQIIINSSSVGGSIVGSWGKGHYTDSNGAEYLSLTFYPNGYYIHYESDDPSSEDDNGGGVEYGKYDYNSQTGKLVVTSLIVNENGDHGLSDYIPGGDCEATVTIDGNTITFSEICEGGWTETDTFERVKSDSSPIVGSWGKGHYTDSNGAEYLSLTFYPNGYYIHYESDDPSSEDDNGGGVEYGKYDYNSQTGKLVVTSLIVNENGDHGLSDYVPGGECETTVTIDDDTITFSDICEDGWTETHTFERVKRR